MKIRNQRFLAAALFLLYAPLLFCQTNAEPAREELSVPPAPVLPAANQITGPFTATNNPLLNQETTNTALTNELIKKSAVTKTKKSSRMVNLGFYYLFPAAPFKNKFSRGFANGNAYYRMPANSWNDPFSIVLDYDWRLFNLPGFRWGWSLGLNFAGSGNGDDSIEVPAGSDLGQAQGSTFYAIYNDYHFPLLVNIKYFPVKISVFRFYAGAGAGFFTGIYTYNELVQKERSSFEEQYEKTFVVLQPLFQVFLGFHFDISESFSTIFVELNLKFAKDPVVKNDFLKPDPRSVSFQISGLSLGAGFRY